MLPRHTMLWMGTLCQCPTLAQVVEVAHACPASKASGLEGLALQQQQAA